MEKILRGYAKDKNGKLILVGSIPVSQARTNRARSGEELTIFKKEVIG